MAEGAGVDDDVVPVGGREVMKKRKRKRGWVRRAWWDWRGRNRHGRR